MVPLKHLYQYFFPAVWCSLYLAAESFSWRWIDCNSCSSLFIWRFRETLYGLRTISFGTYFTPTGCMVEGISCFHEFTLVHERNPLHFRYQKGDVTIACQKINNISMGLLLFGNMCKQGGGVSIQSTLERKRDHRHLWYHRVTNMPLSIIWLSVLSPCNWREKCSSAPELYSFIKFYV